MSESCVVRQPVFGVAGSLLGYEVRYNEALTPEEDGNFSSSVLSGTFDIIRDKLPAFVRTSRAMLLDGSLLTAQPGSVVAVIAPDVIADDEVMGAIERFRAAEGSIALDDMSMTPGHSDSLLPVADWIRLNARKYPAETLADISCRVSSLLGNRPSPRCMATEIGELKHYEASLAGNASAFQGSFFSRPEPLPTAELPASTVAAMRLLGMLRSGDVDDRQLEDVIATDPALTFQLLRLVNSSALGGRGISSIGQALRLIGRSTFLRWLAIAVAVGKGAGTDVDQELVRQALERGRFIEQFANNRRDPGTLFLVGLFSLLDGLFRMPLEEILKRVELSPEATEALLNRSGPYALTLDLVESYEIGLFENATLIGAELDISQARITDAYKDAIIWAAEALSSGPGDQTSSRAGRAA